MKNVILLYLFLTVPIVGFSQCAEPISTTNVKGVIIETFYPIRLSVDILDMQKDQIYIFKGEPGRCYKVNEIVHIYYNKEERVFYEVPNSPYYGRMGQKGIDLYEQGKY